MTITALSIAEKIKSRLREYGDGRSFYGPEVDPALQEALTRVGHKVALNPDPNVRALLQKDFTLTLSSGIVDLTTHVTASEPMLIEYIRKGTLTHSSSSYPLQWLPDKASLSLSRPTDFIYYCVDGLTLRTLANNSLTSLTGTINARVNHVPLITTISTKPSLEDLLVDEVMMVLGLMKAEVAA